MAKHLRLNRIDQKDVDDWCDRFEEAQVRGAAPRIEDFLPPLPEPVRRTLLHELVWLEMAHRQSRGERPRLAEYAARFPDAADLFREPVSGDPERTEPLGAAVVRLKIIRGPHAGEARVIDGHQTLVVGKAYDVQWRIPNDPYLSRYHFRIEANPPLCRLIDLESKNGTLVNGEAVHEAALAHGDRVECGETIFAVTVEAAGGSGPPAEVPPTAALAAPPPARVGEFALERELARGRMSIVYRGLHVPTGRPAAIKFLEVAAKADSAALTRFLQAAAALRNVRHRRIVQHLGEGLHAGQPFVALEYLPVVELRPLVAAAEPAKQIRLACGVVCRALEGLAHLHSLGLVHREIKPSNILVFRQAARLQVKLGDFGLAQHWLDSGLSSLSTDNELRSTLGFIAPEQLIDCRRAEPAGDIYSAAACLFYFLTCRLPVEPQQGRSPLAAAFNESARSVAQFAPNLPPPLIAAIDRALCRQPEQRFATAAELRSVLVPFAEKHSETDS